MKDTILTVDGQKVLVKLYASVEKPCGQAILLLHGCNGRRPNELAAEQFSSRGYYCAAVAFRGHEGSDGDIRSITTENSLADAVAAYDYLHAHMPEESEIIVVGSSYGSYIAVLLSTVRPVKALSLRVPANYPDVTFYDPKWGDGSDNPITTAWRGQPVNASENMALYAISDFQGDIQIIESGADEQIPHQTVQNYVDAVPNSSRFEHHLMSGWPHSISDDAKSNEYVALVQKWLNKLSKKTL